MFSCHFHFIPRLYISSLCCGSRMRTINNGSMYEILAPMHFMILYFPEINYSTDNVYYKMNKIDLTVADNCSNGIPLRRNSYERMQLFCVSKIRTIFNMYSCRKNPPLHISFLVVSHRSKHSFQWLSGGNIIHGYFSDGTLMKNGPWSENTYEVCHKVSEF